jgi:hypothetical protein
VNRKEVEPAIVVLLRRFDKWQHIAKRQRGIPAAIIAAKAKPPKRSIVGCVSVHCDTVQVIINRIMQKRSVYSDKQDQTVSDQIEVEIRAESLDMSRKVVVRQKCPAQIAQSAQLLIAGFYVLQKFLVGLADCALCGSRCKQ